MQPFFAAEIDLLVPNIILGMNFSRRMYLGNSISPKCMETTVMLVFNF